jgi:hypothetical protein
MSGRRSQLSMPEATKYMGGSVAGTSARNARSCRSVATLPRHLRAIAVHQPFRCCSLVCSAVIAYVASSVLSRATFRLLLHMQARCRLPGSILNHLHTSSCVVSLSSPQRHPQQEEVNENRRSRIRTDTLCDSKDHQVGSVHVRPCSMSHISNYQHYSLTNSFKLVRVLCGDEQPTS